jgi:hypothetical protein
VPSHGTNRGSNPLRDARDFNGLLITLLAQARLAEIRAAKGKLTSAKPVGAPALPLGTRGTLQLDSVGASPAFSIRNQTGWSA